MMDLKIRGQKLPFKQSFFICEEFLAPLELFKISDYVLKKKNNFKPSQVISSYNDKAGQVYPVHRKSSVLLQLGKFSTMFKNRIYSYLPLIFENLNLASFAVSRIQTQITASNDGDYFKLHNDNSHPLCQQRKISFVYYFHKEPKPFSGGELLLYDTISYEGKFFAEKEFQLITPHQNMIIFFISSCMHEVVPVNCPSKIFADSRFTLNGWIYT